VLAGGKAIAHNQRGAGGRLPCAPLMDRIALTIGEEAGLREAAPATMQ